MDLPIAPAPRRYSSGSAAQSKPFMASALAYSEAQESVYEGARSAPSSMYTQRVIHAEHGASKSRLTSTQELPRGEGALRVAGLPRSTSLVKNMTTVKVSFIFIKMAGGGTV